MAALGHHEEFALQVRTSRCTDADIAKLLIQVAPHAGKPASNAAMRVAKQVLGPLRSGAPAGIGKSLFRALPKALDDSYRLIDGAIIRTPSRAVTGKGGAPDQAPGRSRSGLNTEIHLLADGLGRPVRTATAPERSSDHVSACGYRMLTGCRHAKLNTALIPFRTSLA